MSNTLMGTLQQAIRNTFGCANDFNGDLHVLCDYWGIPMVPISGRTIDVSRKYDASITDATSALNYLLYNPTIAVPALGLNFVNNETLDPRITFSRTSNATQFDSAGNLVYAPHNLLTFSESFDNAAFTKTRASVTANAAAAPNGTTTADKLVEDTTASNTHQAFQSQTATAGLTYVYSVYAKAAERTQIAVNISSGAGAFAAAAQVIVDLTSGAVVSGAGTVTALPDGWYRISVSNTAIATAAADFVLRISVGGNTSYTGNGTSGLFLWGAQLNIGTLQPYYPTTVKNLLGYSQEFDNAAWTKSNSFVQTNQIRNNTMQGAVAGSPGTSPTNWIISSSASGITREITGVGIESGISYVDVRFSGTPTAGTNVVVSFESTNQIAATAGQTWTESAFVKLQAGSFVGTSTTVSLLATDGTNGTEGFNSALITSTPSNLRDCRLLATGTLASGLGTTHVQPRVRIGCTVGVAFDITLRIGWPQLVQGAVAGDPVATYGTARAVMYPAPDGSVTGDKLVETTVNAQHVVFRSTTIVANTPHAASGYFKAGERTRINFRLLNGSFNSGANITFDLSSGTIPFSSVVGTGSSLSFSITSVGNGWYRCFASCIVDATSTSAVWAAYLVNTGNNDTYTGDGTSGIYIWGAQLSDSASLDPYVYNPVAAPTAAAYYGPRFDYDPSTLAARGLLIEEQRTNSIRNNSMVGAVAGTPGTLPTNWIVSGQGLTTNVIGTGTSAGITYVDLQITGTPTGSPYVLSFESSAISAAASQTWTESAWFALVGGNLTNVGTINLRMRVYDSGSVFLGQSDSAALTLTSSLVRNSHNYPSLPALTAFIEPALRVGLTAGQAVNFTIRIGLPQLELGAFATSVIPTTTAAATRTADVATMVGANFSNWYRQDEGTLFAETQLASTSARISAGFDINDGTTNNRTVFRAITAGGADQVVVRSATTTVASLSSAVSPTAAVRRTAVSYKVNDFALSANGAAPVTDTSGTVPVAVNQMLIGYAAGPAEYLGGYIRRIGFFPTRLTDAQLQAVTA